MKVGKRLVTKLFNAAKFVLAQSAADGPGHAPARPRASWRGSARRSARATALFDELDYADALDAIERFFWTGFTDNYLELVKARARSETDAGGPRLGGARRCSSGLSVLLRLFAPFLPYVTEEVWSWGFAEATGLRSIHRAPWPGPAEIAAWASRARPGAPSTRRAPSSRPCGAPRAPRAPRSAATWPRCASRRARAPSRCSRPCVGDLRAAARVEGEVLEARDGPRPTAFEVVEIELAEKQARAEA